MNLISIPTLVLFGNYPGVSNIVAIGLVAVISIGIVSYINKANSSDETAISTSTFSSQPKPPADPVPPSRSGITDKQVERLQVEADTFSTPSQMDQLQGASRLREDPKAAAVTSDAKNIDVDGAHDSGGTSE